MVNFSVLLSFVRATFLTLMVFIAHSIEAKEKNSHKILMLESSSNTYLTGCNQEDQSFECDENVAFKLHWKGKFYSIPEFEFKGIRVALTNPLIVIQGITTGSHPHADWRFIYLAENKIKKIDSYGTCLWSFVPDPIEGYSSQFKGSWSLEQNGMVSKKINLNDLDRDGLDDLVIRILPNVYMGSMERAVAAGVIKEGDDVSKWPTRFITLSRDEVKENRNPKLYKRYYKDIKNTKNNFLIYYYGVMANEIGKEDYKKFGLNESVLPIFDTLNLEDCKAK